MKESQIVWTGTSPSVAGAVIAAAGQFPYASFATADFFTIDWLSLGATGDTLKLCIQRRVLPNVWSDWVSMGAVAAAAAASPWVTMIAANRTSGVSNVGGGSDSVATPLASFTGSATVLPGDDIRIVWLAGAATTAGAAQTVVITHYHLR